MSVCNCKNSSGRCICPDGMSCCSELKPDGTESIVGICCPLNSCNKKGYCMSTKENYTPANVIKKNYVYIIIGIGVLLVLIALGVYIYKRYKMKKESASDALFISPRYGRNQLVQESRLYVSPRFIDDPDAM